MRVDPSLSERSIHDNLVARDQEEENVTRGGVGILSTCRSQQ